MLSLKAPQLKDCARVGPRQHVLKVSQFVKALNNEAQAASWTGNQKFHN